jgi:ribosome-associated toxin RatA of RatAB toxin-antitoxin module
MIRLQRRLLVEREPEEVFRLLSDPARYPEFIVGITRWRPLSGDRRGPGARYRILMRVGSIEAGGVVRVGRWEENRLIEWTSERGIHQTGRWDLQPAASGTEVRLTLEFDLSGGPVGWLVERLAGRMVSRNMYATLLAVRRLLEYEGPSTSSSSSTSAGPTRAMNPN